MLRAAAIVLAVALGLAAAGPFARAADRTPLPALEKATPGTQCVEPPQAMRSQHMHYLKHQRDDTVRGGIRGAKYSLKDCVDCHASRATGSVVKAQTDFCASCHRYAAVSIDCFECHTGRPARLAKGGGAQ